MGQCSPHCACGCGGSRWRGSAGAFENILKMQRWPLNVTRDGGGRGRTAPSHVSGLKSGIVLLFPSEMTCIENLQIFTFLFLMFLPNQHVFNYFFPALFLMSPGQLFRVFLSCAPALLHSRCPGFLLSVNSSHYKLVSWNYWKCSFVTDEEEKGKYLRYHLGMGLGPELSVKKSISCLGPIRMLHQLYVDQD